MANLAAAPVINVVTLTRTQLARGVTTTSLARTMRRPVHPFSFAVKKDVQAYAMTKLITDTIYKNGNPVGAGVIVKLMRQTDDFLVAQTVTNGSGVYSFTRDSEDVCAYYLISYESAGSPQYHGVSDRNIYAT